MCTGGEFAAVASLLSTGVSAVAANSVKSPPKPQAAKTPDAGLSEEKKRSKLLAQLAAGASRNNPSGGLAGGNTGAVTLGT